MERIEIAAGKFWKRLSNARRNEQSRVLNLALLNEGATIFTHTIFAIFNCWQVADLYVLPKQCFGYQNFGCASWRQVARIKSSPLIDLAVNIIVQFIITVTKSCASCAFPPTLLNAFKYSRELAWPMWYVIYSMILFTLLQLLCKLEFPLSQMLF